MKTTPLALALDYSVLDHLQNIQDGTYKGKRELALSRIRAAAECGRVEIWITEITPVEMLHGIEKIIGDEASKELAKARDQTKQAIALAMHARKLAYPDSKLGDSYSRLGMSFRTCGRDTERAIALEAKLL